MCRRASPASTPIDRNPRLSPGHDQERPGPCAPPLEPFSDEGLDWLKTAARLPGKSLHLALALYSLVSAQRTHHIKLGNLASHEFGVDRNAKYRALAWLEHAGLVQVERKIGRSPLVTILCQTDLGGGLNDQPASSPDSALS